MRHTGVAPLSSPNLLKYSRLARHRDALRRESMIMMGMCPQHGATTSVHKGLATKDIIGLVAGFIFSTIITYINVLMKLGN